MNYLETVGKKLLSQIIVIEQIGWPPTCMGNIYQPERPVYNRSAMEKAADDSEKK